MLKYFKFCTIFKKNFDRTNGKFIYLWQRHLWCLNFILKNIFGYQKIFLLVEIYCLQKNIWNNIQYLFDSSSTSYSKSKTIIHGSWKDKSQKEIPIIRTSCSCGLSKLILSRRQKNNLQHSISVIPPPMCRGVSSFHGALSRPGQRSD